MLDATHRLAPYCYAGGWFEHCPLEPEWQFGSMFGMPRTQQPQRSVIEMTAWLMFRPAWLLTSRIAAVPVSVVLALILGCLSSPCWSAHDAPDPGRDVASVAAPAVLTVAALADFINQPNREQAALELRQAYALDPVQADALVALQLVDLENVSDADLRRMAVAFMPQDDEARVRLASKRLSAGAGAALPFGTDEPVQGHLSGGVEFVLERLVVAGDRLDFALEPLAGRQWLASAGLIAASSDQRVRIDTRRTAFESCNFRGVLGPKRCEIERVSPPIGASLNPDMGLQQRLEVRWMIRLFDPRPFRGFIRGEQQSWVPMSGQADLVTAEVVADFDAGQLVNPRLALITLHGQPGQAAMLRIEQDGQAVSSQSQSIDLLFDSRGQFAEARLGTDAQVSSAPLGFPRN